MTRRNLPDRIARLEGVADPEPVCVTVHFIEAVNGRPGREISRMTITPGQPSTFQTIDTAGMEAKNDGRP